MLIFMRKKVAMWNIPFVHHLKEMVCKQGRIHGSPVADGWAGAVIRKPLGIQKCDGPTDGPIYRPTDRHGKV